MTIMDYDLGKIVRKDHEMRKVDEIISFNKLALGHKDLESCKGRQGYGVEVGIRCLFLQFYYDLSDRELETRLRDDNGFKWFCGFKIDDETPDHSYFSRIRQALGAKRIGKIFKWIQKRAEDAGILKKVFIFVDSSAIVSKNTTWEERDKAIREGEEKLNNENVSEYSADKDARFGCKGKDKFWYGHKKHISADMGSGLITGVAVTPANVSDADGLKNVCPKEGMVFADKAYCTRNAQNTIKANGCHSGAILKNNMKGKDRRRDKWLSRIRAPFEGIFSKQEKRARYRGIAKNQMQAFLEAIVFNVKRLVTLDAPPLFAGA